MKLFHQLCEENGIIHNNKKIFEYVTTFEMKQNHVQLSLFHEKQKYLYMGETLILEEISDVEELMNLVEKSQ